MTPRLLWSLAALLLATPASAAPHARPQDLELPWIFADHMVLQCDQPAPIWGCGPPKTRVEVEFGDLRRSTISNASGEWRIDLPPMSRNVRGEELRVRAGSVSRSFGNVVVGEVWLCAGQSNMDFPLHRAVGGDAATRRVVEAGLRLCNRTGNPDGGRRRLSPKDLERITTDDYFTGTWRMGDPNEAQAFSAVGAFFGLELRAVLDGPIGLIDVSVGGSSTEGWVPLHRLAENADLAPLAHDYLNTDLSHPFIRERTRFQLGNWIDAGQPDPAPRHFFEPGFLYAAAIDSLAPFGTRGVLWYQGESNAHRPRIADLLFRLLVDDWRRAWNRPDLPFHFVQLPGMDRPTWPEMREVQAAWLDIPHTAMAVAIDVGDPTDVHPRDKQPVGERLARLARSRVYGHEVAARGPSLLSARSNGGQIELSFAHAEGLRFADGVGAGFEIAGQNGHFYPAVAQLEGTRVVVHAPEVGQPEWVRYAWSPFPACSLFNGAGLPAPPFRTDDFAGR